MRRIPWPWLAAAIVALIALVVPWIDSVRPAPPSTRASREMVVTAAADSGAGSLREAIFAADRAGERSRITFRVPRVKVTTTLPALVNPEGIVIDGGGLVIDARALGDAPLFDLAAPGHVLLNLAIEGGSEAVRVRADRARLSNVTVREAGVAVRIAGVRNVSVEHCTFTRNDKGIMVEGDARGIVVHDSRFDEQRTAGIWAVAAASDGRSVLAISRNKFDRNPIGIAMLNVGGAIERNELTRSSDAAILIGGRRGEVRRNRLRGGAFGIRADAAEGAIVEENEIDHNSAVGILLKDSANCAVRRNRIHANGYGIAQVFGRKGAPNVIAHNQLLDHRYDALYLVGASPIVRDNNGAGNRSAAIRLLDFVRGSERTSANPVLEANVFRGNLFDAPVRGDYSEAKK